MKYFDPGERFSFLRHGNKFLVFRAKDGKYARKCWGGVCFTHNIRQATKWKNLDQAIAWARKMNLA